MLSLAFKCNSVYINTYFVQILHTYNIHTNIRFVCMCMHICCTPGLELNLHLRYTRCLLNVNRLHLPIHVSSILTVHHDEFARLRCSLNFRTKICNPPGRRHAFCSIPAHSRRLCFVIVATRVQHILCQLDLPGKFTVLHTSSINGRNFNVVKPER